MIFTRNNHIGLLRSTLTNGDLNLNSRVDGDGSLSKQRQKLSKRNHQQQKKQKQASDALVSTEIQTYACQNLNIIIGKEVEETQQGWALTI